MLARLNRTISWQRSLILFQWLIPFVSIYFIWVIVDSKSQNSNFIFLLEKVLSEINFYFFGALMIALTLLNISLESLKWRHVINNFQTLSYFESFIQTLKAMAAGFITPFKSGALLARILSNEKTDKLKILDATIQMAVAQFTITFVFGVAGFIFWSAFNHWNYLLASSIILLFFSIAFIFYFSKFPFQFVFQKREWKGLSFDSSLLLFSFLRYVTFSFQYVILLRVFGADIEWALAFSLVSITFLVNSLLPAGILGKLGVRELSGILIIGETTGFVMEVSCAAFIIWILNQALPAISGSLLFLNRNSRTF